VESLMLCFKTLGHEVISLSQQEGVEINPFLRAKGIEAHSYVIPGKAGFLYYIKHFLYFILFCKRKRVSVVFSHLDSSNFVAALGQFFIGARVYLCRHHTDEAALYNYHLSWTYKLTNTLAKKIIVVSRRSMDYMINVENVLPAKLMHINLGYNFSLYAPPEKSDVRAIREKYSNGLLLITVCRLTRFKRPELSISVLQELKAKGVNASLVLLGNGDLREDLERITSECGLTDRVFLLGHVNNALDYLAAADFVLHPSVLESSCVVVKEAGLVKKPVIVCQRIGDFDDYITEGRNGFLVNKDRFVEEAVRVIAENFENRILLEELGNTLFRDISTLFDIKNVISNYDFVDLPQRHRDAK
jgi:glycosyltransferase involved in cell wall biosynthesis